MTLALCVSGAHAQTTEFTYQGRLINGGLPASVPHDFEFRLFSVETGGAPIGGIVESRPGVQVSNGVFTVRLNFGDQFDGAARWLEISVRQTGSSTFALLNPRQPLSSAPYSVKSLNSDTSTTSTNAAQLNGIPASQYVVTSDPRMTDARPPTAGSADYVQNRTTEQTGTNFNVSGNGTVGGVLTTSSGTAAAPSITFTGDTGTGFFRSAPGTLRFSTGGTSRMVIDPNGRIGLGTEVFTTPTRFFAVEDNPSASSAYGIFGRANGTTGSRTGVVGLSFFPDAQAAGTTGYGVSGSASGATQNYGVVGNAFGAGTFNAGVFGSASGATLNYAGFFSGNTFVGGAGIVRSFINSDSNAGLALTLNNQPGWSVATVSGGQFQIYNDSIGQNAFWIDSTTNNTGIGTLTPNARLDVAGSINTSTQFNIGGNRVLSNAGTSNMFSGQGTGVLGTNNAFFGSTAGAAATAFSGSNSFFGSGAGFTNADGSNNAFFGTSAGGNNSGPLANANTFIGSGSGSGNVTGRANTMLGFQANTPFPGGLINATAVGFRAFVTQDNSLVLGSISGVNSALADTNVGIGTTAPTQRLHVVGNGLVAGDLTVTGTLNANIPGGSGNYIQNNPPTQQGASFNIAGNGTIGGSLLVHPVSGNATVNIRNRTDTGYAQTVFYDHLGNYRGYIGFLGANSPFPGARNDTVEFGTSGKDLTFRPNETEVMRLGTNGNVGIGAFPAAFYKLLIVNPSSPGGGIFAESNFTGNADGYGVFGRAVNNPGFGFGGNFVGGARGVYAQVDGGNSTGTAIGVHSFATGSAGSRYGMFSLVNMTGGNTAYGILAGTTGSAATNWAGFFQGNVNVTGTLSKGGGAFRIDHPLDPQNKYLLHSFVESPDMMNIYNGNVTTDPEGNATIKLPDWFDALNRDFRYQLTVIGQFAQAIVAEKIKDNQFRIKTDKPEVEVSWQVTGIRKDKFAEDNRIKVEEDKLPEDKGKCLHAPLCGGKKIDPAEEVLREQERRSKP